MILLTAENNPRGTHFNTTISQTRDDVDGVETVGVPATVFVLAVSGILLHLAAGGSVGDERDGRDETEGKDGRRENRSCGETLGERCDDDGSDCFY